MLNFEIFEYQRNVELCYEIELKNFKLFYHFIIEPHSVVAEYFENSAYFHIYDVNYTVKIKNSDRYGSKRSLEEDEDKTLKSINNLGKKMKKMKAQFHPSEVEIEKEIDLKIVSTTEDSLKNLKNIENNVVFSTEDIFEVRKYESTKHYESRSKLKVKPKKALTNKNKSIEAKQITIVKFDANGEIFTNRSIAQTTTTQIIGVFLGTGN